MLTKGNFSASFNGLTVTHELWKYLFKMSVEDETSLFYLLFFFFLFFWEKRTSKSKAVSEIWLQYNKFR